MANVVILGTQWGDEGKGKIVDLFADRFDVVTRQQGGHNAGHTVRVKDKTFILTLVPSGMLRPGTKAVIGNGAGHRSRRRCSKRSIRCAAWASRPAGNLFVSNRAHVIFPFHQMMERA